VLQTNGSGVLSFAGVSASAGQVIQVLSATDSTLRQTTSTSFVTGSNTLSVTITPSSSSNKIFIISNFDGAGVSGESNVIFTIYRGATDLGATSSKGFVGVQSEIPTCPVGMSFLDSPATTSATTYQVYMRKIDASPSNMSMNVNNKKGVITVMEIKG
jgi:hypothetical protein